MRDAQIIKAAAEEKLAMESLDYLTHELDRAYWNLRHKYGEEVANEAASKLPDIKF